MQEIAEVYARSLFEVACEQDSLDRIHDELDELVDALAESRDLQVFFFSPYFSSDEKKDGIAKLLQDADDHTIRFLELLAERHRMPVLFRVRRAFDALWAEQRKLLEVSVTSAISLDDKTVKGIATAIEEQTGRSVELSATVDEDVLGGLVIRVGNMVLDASVRNRLDRVRREVASAA